jgi:hypothetical protein
VPINEFEADFENFFWKMLRDGSHKALCGSAIARAIRRQAKEEIAAG